MLCFNTILLNKLHVFTSRIVYNQFQQNHIQDLIMKGREGKTGNHIPEELQQPNCILFIGGFFVALFILAAISDVLGVWDGVKGMLNNGEPTFSDTSSKTEQNITNDGGEIGDNAIFTSGNVIINPIEGVTPVPTETILNQNGESATINVAKGRSRTIRVADEIITISILEQVGRVAYGRLYEDAIDINISGAIGSRTFNDFRLGQCIHFHPILLTYIKANVSNGLVSSLTSSEFTVYSLGETAKDSNLCPDTNPKENLSDNPDENKNSQGISSTKEGKSEGLTSSPTPSEEISQPLLHYFELHSDEDWQDLDISLEVGDIIEVEQVSDSWSVCEGCPYIGQEGWTEEDSWDTDNKGQSKNYGDNIILGCPHGALIARFSGRSIFCIDGNQKFEVLETKIQLRINDARVQDNKGSIFFRFTNERLRNPL